MNPDKLLTLLMGKKWQPDIEDVSCESCGEVFSVNPDFSDPRHRDEFFTWLCRERDGMFYEFTFWAYTRKCPLPDKDAYYVWLFFSDPARPRDLMAEWLRLDETIKRFGWVKCPNCDVFNTGFCTTCGGSGKVLSAWAKYAKEGTI